MTATDEVRPDSTVAADAKRREPVASGAGAVRPPRDAIGSNAGPETGDLLGTPGQRAAALLTARSEPETLRRGKAFHAALQASWAERHGGDGADPEYLIAATADRRGGRMDVLVHIEGAAPKRGDVAPFKAVLEAKDRDFDRLSSASVRRLIRRDRRQILGYVASLIDLSSAAPATDDESHVMPAMVYRRSPTDPAVRDMIEAFFDEELIAVTWEDESVAQSKARLG